MSQYSFEIIVHKAEYFTVDMVRLHVLELMSDLILHHSIGLDNTYHYVWIFFLNRRLATPKGTKA